MATTATPKPVSRRVLLRMPIHVGTFLDLMCRLSGRRKRQVVDMIWAEGMRSVFGITPDELSICRMSIPPRTHVLTDDLRELTELVCGER